MSMMTAYIKRNASIGESFRKHASLQAIDYVLKDWQSAHLKLGLAIERMKELREERAGQIARGEWPAPQRPMHGYDPDDLADLLPKDGDAKAREALGSPTIPLDQARTEASNLLDGSDG